MEDSQRQAMYDGWAAKKKWTRVEVKKLDDDRTSTNDETWEARVIDAPFGCVYRPTRILAIQKIQGLLAERGYEISNLFELFSKEEIKREQKLYNDLKNILLPEKEERRTFLEWCKELYFRRQKKE